METTTFTALCERAGRWWMIHVPQVDGVTAQVRSLDQAEIVTRQLISRSLGVPAESIRIDVLPDAPAPVADALEALAGEGVTFHDAATMLGLSPAETELYRSRAGSFGDPTEQSTPDPLQLAWP